jgi:hypothetical protein
LGNRIEDRKAVHLLSTFAGRYSPDHLCPVGHGLARMKHPLLTGNPLADNPGVFIDQDAHK